MHLHYSKGTAPLVDELRIGDTVTFSDMTRRRTLGEWLRRDHQTQFVTHEVRTITTDGVWFKTPDDSWYWQAWDRIVGYRGKARLARARKTLPDDYQFPRPAVPSRLIADCPHSQWRYEVGTRDFTCFECGVLAKALVGYWLGYNDPPDGVTNGR